MTNDELIRIYDQALKDWNVMQDNFNNIEDRTIENIKKEFADQCEQQGLFLIVRQGYIEAYLSKGVLEEPFTIRYKDYVQPYVYVEDIKKRIESLA